MSRGRSTALSQAVVIDGALAVARSKGLAGLTMRAVATELGVTPMALYRYVEDKEQLVSLVVDAAIATLRPLEAGTDDWEVAIAEHLVERWEQLTQYPGLGAHLIERPVVTPAEAAMQEGVALLESAGFERHEAQLAWSCALTWLHGRLSVDARLEATRGGSQRERSREYAAYGATAVAAGLRAQLERRDDDG